MREWTRVRLATMCGRCGDLVPPGDPILVIRLAGVKRLHYRCAHWRCAESPVPIDLPPLEPLRSASGAAGLVPLVRIAHGPGRLPLDWKQRQSGDES